MPAELPNDTDTDAGASRHLVSVPTDLEFLSPAFPEETAPEDELPDDDVTAAADAAVDAEEAKFQRQLSWARKSKFAAQLPSASQEDLASDDQPRQIAAITLVTLLSLGDQQRHCKLSAYLFPDSMVKLEPWVMNWLNRPIDGSLNGLDRKSATLAIKFMSRATESAWSEFNKLPDNQKRDRKAPFLLENRRRRVVGLFAENGEALPDEVARTTATGPDWSKLNEFKLNIAEALIKIDDLWFNHQPSFSDLSADDHASLNEDLRELFNTSDLEVLRPKVIAINRALRNWQALADRASQRKWSGLMTTIGEATS